MNKARSKIRIIAAVCAAVFTASFFKGAWAESKSVFEDEMENLSKIYDCEGSFLIKNDLEHPEDQYRIYKSAVEKQSITYKTERAISGYEIKTYSTQQSADKIVEIYLSLDGETWDKSDFVFDVEPGYVDSWSWSYLTQKKPVTNNYYYLKIVIGDNKNTWNPQISNVAIFMDGLTGREYVPEEPEPMPKPSYSEYKNQAEAAVVFGNNILEQSKSKPDMVLTRGEFARALLELIGLDTKVLRADINGDIRDVDRNTEYADAIYTSVFYKMMYCYSDRSFDPEAEVTYIQAIRGIVQALGYAAEINTDAEYIIKANELGLLRGVELSDNNRSLSRENAITLLYNALNTPPMLWSGDQYYSKSKATILEGQKHIEKRKGQITATYFGSLSGNDVDDEDSVEIDGVLYKTHDRSIGAFLGYGVCFYINEEDEITAYSLLDRGAKPITVLRGNMLTGKEDYESGKFVYDNGEGKVKTVRFSFDFMAYNGLKTDISFENLSTADAYVTLYDSDEDNIYDTAMIEKYSYIIVKSVNAEKQVIQGIYGEVLNAEDADRVIFCKGGKTLEISEIKSGDTLSILESKNKKYVRAYIRTVKLKGRVSAMSEDKLTIKDLTYTIAPSYKALCESGAAQYPEPGSDGTFYLGSNYEIIGFTANTAAWQYAYVLDGGCEDYGMNLLRLNLYTDDGRFVTYKASDMRVKESGKTKTLSSDEFNSVFMPDGTFKECVVSVNYNSDGSIRSIDKDVKLDSETTVGSFNGSNILCGSYPVTSNTKVFSIPADRKRYDSYDVRLDLVEGDTRPNSSDMKYHMRFYELNDMNEPEVLVIYRSEKNDLNRSVITKAPSVVNGIREVYNEQTGEVQKKLFLGADNHERGYEVSDYVRLENMQPGQSSFSDLTRGDIILYAINGSDQIVRIFVLYHTDGKAFIGAGGLTPSFGENISIHPDYPIAYGSVKNFNSDFLVADTGEKITAVSTSASTRYYTIDMNSQNQSIELASKNDVRFGDTVLLRTVRFAASDIFIIRN